ncbi:hypothetical protein ACXZ65_39015, partial [Streptomyces aculeolatus]
PGTAPLPGDAHETVVAVAALLTEQHDQAVTLNRSHPDGAYKDAGDGFGCGCGVTIDSVGDVYDFHRGGSEWPPAPRFGVRCETTRARTAADSTSSSSSPTPPGEPRWLHVA